MSGDEEGAFVDSNGTVHRDVLLIHSLEWRAEILREWGQKLDDLDLMLRFSNGMLPTKGNFPRKRYDPQHGAKPTTIREEYNIPAVKGLPRIMYSEPWLASLEEFQRRALEIDDTPFSLDFSEQILK